MGDAKKRGCMAKHSPLQLTTWDGDPHIAHPVLSSLVQRFVRNTHLPILGQTSLFWRVKMVCANSNPNKVVG